MPKSHDQIRLEHIAWFDKHIRRDSIIEPLQEPKVHTPEQRIVWKYWTKELHLSIQTLKNTSLQEAYYEAHVISYFELQTHVMNQTLTYPFKTA